MAKLTYTTDCGTIRYELQDIELGGDEETHVEIREGQRIGSRGRFTWETVSVPRSLVEKFMMKSEGK
jgi:hypothetical protein